MSLRRVAARWRHLLSRSRRAVLVAAFLRRQTGYIIGGYLGPSIDPRKNGEAWFARLIAPRVTSFVDVGANVGAWTAMLLQSIPGASLRCGLLIEPSSSAANRLRERFKTNPNIHVLEAAASDSSGEAAFFEEANAGQTSSLIPGFSLPGARMRKVPVITLDEACERHGLNTVGLIKIDAEGCDCKVLEGARRLLSDHKIGAAQFEYNRPWARAGSTLAHATHLLESLGYTVLLLRGESLYRLDYLQYGEYFDYSNFVAISPPMLPTVKPFIRGTI